MQNGYLRTADVRRELCSLLQNKKFTTVSREKAMTSIVGSSTIEIVGASFIADEDSIFGEVNWDYVAREEAWYNSQSLNVNDIPGGAPQVWKAVASEDGFINSNYGYLLHSFENHCQYDNIIRELKKNPESRRAIAIYTRPSIWFEYDIDGMSDFICTNTVQYLVRDGKLNAVVQMRSNDAVFGHKNDRAWQFHVLDQLAAELGNLEVGNIIWQVGSLHVYSRHYYMVHHYSETGEISISKERYKELYPSSEFV